MTASLVGTLGSQGRIWHKLCRQESERGRGQSYKQGTALTTLVAYRISMTDMEKYRKSSKGRYKRALRVGSGVGYCLFPVEEEYDKRSFLDKIAVYWYSHDRGLS